MQNTFSPHILWLFLAMFPALVFAQPMAPHAQKGVSQEVLLQSKTLNCGDLVFSLQVINNGSGCCYRLKADNSTPDNCFINVALNLDMGAFANFAALPGWQYNTGGPAEYTIRPFIGFIPPGSSSLAEFCIDGTTSATLTLLWDDLCVLEGCAATFDVNGCLDPGDASITGVKYRECGSLTYTNQPVLSDWTIQLLDADSNVIAEQVTDVDGAYAFYDLKAGSYVIKETQQSGWTPKVPASGQSTVVLDPSENEVRNFGNCPGCSCDSIYMDVVQVPGVSDTCDFGLNMSNSGAYCFSELNLSLATGSFVEIDGNGLNVTIVDSQHVTLSGALLIAGGQVPYVKIRTAGASAYEITVSTFYNIGSGNVSCSRAFSFVCPPPMSPPPCCPAGSQFGPELTKNGDFELGNQDFTNDYTYFNPGSPTTIGAYSVLNQTQVFAANSQWACLDHTSFGSAGQMLIVDGYGGPIAWQQTVTVTAGTNYSFYAWFNNLVIPTKNHDDPQMALFVGNTQIAGPLNLPESPDQWVRICGTWTAMASGTVVLSIRMLATTDIGNDVAIDDISFRACIPPPPCQTSIQFTQNPDCTVTVCAVTTGPQPVSYQWCDGRTDACFTAAQLPCVSSSYCVTATCADGTTSTANGTFTGTDITPPVAVCKPGEGVDLGSACNYQVNPSFVDGGSTDNCGIFSMTVSPSTLAACTNTLVTLTVTDHCGNTSTCTMGIQTIESDPPIMNCPANTSVIGTYDPNGLCTAIFSPTTPVAIDNCDPSVTVTNNAPAVLQQGPNTITWTATDDCGNQTVCTQIVTVECDECCKDEQAFQLYARPSTGAPSIALSCGGTYDFGCPDPGQSIPITGKFECVGNNCPQSAQINWSLQGPGGAITNGTVQAGPYFYLTVSPLSYASAGTYTLTLQGNCGGTDCTPCVIKFNVSCTDPCPCDVPQFQMEVEKGFATALWNNSCNACFSPIALNDCEKVEWKVNNTSVGMTNGIQSFCRMFSSPGSYTIDMIVSRFQANGSPCETFTFTKTVQITCLPAPVCDNAVFENPGFEEGAVAGGLNSGGASSGWLAPWGDPHVVIDDGKWKIRLTGNLDTADVLSTETAMCFEKGPGMVTLRGTINKARSNIKNIAIFFNTGDNYEFNEFNPASCFRIATLDLAQYDSSWFDLEIPYDLSSWAALDSCGDAPHGVLVKPIVYATSFLGNNQGGEETRAEFDLDHLCFNADLVGLDDLPRNKRLRIFPNPNPGTFTVQLPEPAKPGLSFRIINLTGQLLREQYTQIGNTQQTVQAGDLPAGLYFLEVRSEGKVLATEKFIKQ